MSIIKENEVISTRDYLECYLNLPKPIDELTLSELENMELPQWNYPLDEIEYCIENNINVVLVQFTDGEVRFCEVPIED